MWCLFFIAFSTLALEITLARLLSVITWYHLAFFAISTAMLGMTAGAIYVYLNPQKFLPDSLNQQISRACSKYAIHVVLMLMLLCLLPLELKFDFLHVGAFLLATIACASPFFYSGIVVSAILTRLPAPIGKLYAADLTGAALGCLFVLLGLKCLDAPGLILLCGSLGLIASRPLIHEKKLRHSFFIACLIALAFFNQYLTYGIRPYFVKGRQQAPHTHLIDRWNTFSRVVVYPQDMAPPQLWGPSSQAPQTLLPRYYMNIDGDAATVMRRYQSIEDIEHLKYDVTNIGYFLNRRDPVCVIGVGSGRDMQSAILFGHTRILGIDVNPIFIDLLENEFREFAGLADYRGVTFVVDDARSYLSTSKEKFSFIQMSLIDTWAATGAGAFSLSENALYTVEAWITFANRLTDDGIFTVSRWHNPNNIGETGRVIGLALAALLSLDIHEPAKHIALITTDRISTLLLSKTAFSPDDIATLQQTCDELGYTIACVPGESPENNILREILSCTSLEHLEKATRGKDLNYAPPTDENPYFFNMLKLSNLGAALHAAPGVIRGNLLATLTLLVLLISLLIVAVATIVLPLVVKQTKKGRAVSPKPPQIMPTDRPIFFLGAFYFSFIGIGFMHAEIALIQKLSVFLGHPVYALGILLFSLILSTGLGSFFSERYARPVLVPICTIFAILMLPFALNHFLPEWMDLDIMPKVLIVIVMIFPLGLLLGFFFPTGMKLVQKTLTEQTPWFWALNGIWSVVCSALAVFISIYFGISLNFYIAAAAYAGAGLCLHQLHKKLL